MIRKLFCLIIFVIFISLNIYCCPGTVSPETELVLISGTILDQNHIGINQVNISIERDGYNDTTLVTKEDGKYSFTVALPAKGSIVPKKPGYKFDPEKKQFNVSKSNEPNKFDFQGTRVNSVIKFYTMGQQYGVANLDHFWINGSKSKEGALERPCETPDSASVGQWGQREDAFDDQVWDQFGCINQPSTNYPSKSGAVWYKNISPNYIKYVKIRYSKHSSAAVPIEIYVDNVKKNEFIPQDTGDWNVFTETEWLEIVL